MQQNQLHWNFVSTVKAAERQRHLDSGRAKKQKNKDSMYLDHLSQQFFISDSASHANVLPLHCLKVSSRNFAAHWRYRKYMAAEQNNDSMTHRHRTRNQSNKSKFQNNYLIFFFGRQWMKWHFLNVLQTGSFQRVAAKVCVCEGVPKRTSLESDYTNFPSTTSGLGSQVGSGCVLCSSHAMHWVQNMFESSENSCPWWSRWKFMKLMEMVWNEMIWSTAKNWILHNISGLCPGLSSVHLQLFSDLGSKMLRRREKGVGYWAIASNFP